MLSAMLITPKKIKLLHRKRRVTQGLLFIVMMIASQYTFSQYNSPYSRYGLGDVVPSTNVLNRGMGGISVGFSDPVLVNFSNPATYSSFFTYLEARTNEIISGRVVFDIGMNVEGHTIREPENPEKFTSTDALFSYVQVGIPIRKNWGISFGLRPLTKVGYKMIRFERLFDPITGNMIDSALTEYTGDGGAFLPTIGTGVAKGNFSVGVNIGYMFGKKETSTKRALINDSVQYNNSNHLTRTSYGNVFFQGGAQYKIKINTSQLTLGVSGNLRTDLTSKQDVVRETFIRDLDNGDLTFDSVFTQRDIPGTVVYPGQYTAGFVYEKPVTKDNAGFLFGVDYTTTKWSAYRFYEQSDLVQDSWEIRSGFQFKPIAGKGYFSSVDYRAGFFFGRDYINAGGNMPVFGASFGLGLPIPNNNPLARGQFTRINLALEYAKRGNDQNPIRDNTIRLSLGLNMSDLWFGKRKYE